MAARFRLEESLGDQTPQLVPATSLSPLGDIELNSMLRKLISQVPPVKLFVYYSIKYNAQLAIFDDI
jgi:hypothetical protein